jgi:hypothetical protein
MSAKIKKDLATIPAELIAAELATVIEKIKAQGGELEDGDLEALSAWRAALEAKGEAIAFVDARLAKEEEFYGAIEEAAAAKRKARARTREHLRRYLLSCMVTADQKNIKHPEGLFTIVRMPGRSKAVVDNPGALGERFVKIEVVTKPVLDSIKAGLERLQSKVEEAQRLQAEGQPLPEGLEEEILNLSEELQGAHLEVSSDYIQIR